MKALREQDPCDQVDCLLHAHCGLAVNSALPSVAYVSMQGSKAATLLLLLQLTLQSCSQDPIARCGQGTIDHHQARTAACKENEAGNTQVAKHNSRLTGMYDVTQCMYGVPTPLMHHLQHTTEKEAEDTYSSDNGVRLRNIVYTGWLFATICLLSYLCHGSNQHW